MKRIPKGFFIIVLVVAWFILPSTIIPSSHSKIYEINSPDNKYKVIVYHVRIISPMWLYKYLKDEDYFLLFTMHLARWFLNRLRIMALPIWEHMTV